MKKHILSVVLIVTLSASLTFESAAAGVATTHNTLSQTASSKISKGEEEWKTVLEYAEAAHGSTLGGKLEGDLIDAATAQWVKGDRLNNVALWKSERAALAEVRKTAEIMKGTTDPGKLKLLGGQRALQINQLDKISKARFGVNQRIGKAKLTGKLLGKGLNVVGLVSDWNDYNQVKHKSHSSLDFGVRILRGMGMCLTTLDTFGLKMAKAPALAVGIAKDVLNSDVAVSIGNNKFVSWLLKPADLLTDNMNESMQWWGDLFWEWWDGPQNDGSEYIGDKYAEYLRKNRCNSNNAGVYKPNIYIYPEETTPVTVTFRYPGGLTKTIPDYSGNWSVIADPDGKLHDGEKDWDFLFYECITDVSDLSFEEGYMIAADNRYEQLAQLIASYGFNEQETKDFADFWDEKLEKGVGYAVYPMLTEVVDELMPVEVLPAPANLSRLWFAFQKEGTPEREASPVVFDRDGYAVLEWGGLFIR